MKNEKTYELVLTALFTAIIVIMVFTPLGYIPLCSYQRDHHSHPGDPWSAISGTEERRIFGIRIRTYQLYQQYI